MRCVPEGSAIARPLLVFRAVQGRPPTRHDERAIHNSRRKLARFGTAISLAFGITVLLSLTAGTAANHEDEDAAVEAPPLVCDAGTASTAEPATHGDARRCWPVASILAAIGAVESSNRGCVPDGDHRRAIGPFQIHGSYWRDAVAADPTIGGTYQDCRRRDYALRIVAAYLQHYAPDAFAAGDAETLARVHNGGPSGHRRPTTLGFWRRVCSRLAGD
jgi:hypothetical protein